MRESRTALVGAVAQLRERLVLMGRLAAVAVGVLAGEPVLAQVAVGEGGTPSYSQAIAVPPGIAGMTPNLGLLYSGSGVNGPVGLGWSIQGISMIGRCPNIRALDGNVRNVGYTGADKLCLDGQRLIQTDAAGTPLSFPQTDDALGLSSGWREYRTEKDSFARVRAYGTAGSDPANGPQYFKVWTKSGQIYEYGTNANTTANASIAIQGKTAISAWAVSRISDTLSNYIDFQYEQRDVAWGSGPSAGPTLGHEWNLVEVRYTGTTAQAPQNKVVFEYVDRTDAAHPELHDRAETYHLAAKNVSVRRLNAVRTYVNIQATPVKVKTLKLVYEQGPVTRRSRLKTIQECAGAGEDKCLPATTFGYADGGSEQFQPNASFNLQTTPLLSAEGTHGVLTGDFNGDGRTDLLRWSDAPSQNRLFFSNGDGSFTQAPLGSGAGQFNVTADNLFHSYGCFFTYAVDFNGDGLTDLLRYRNPTNALGEACPGVHYLFFSQGDGSFSQVQLQADVVLERVVSTANYPCNGNHLDESCQELGPRVAWTKGANFYLLDVNGDGRLDIVTTTLSPGMAYLWTPPSATSCGTGICSSVYLGDGQGGFTHATSTPPFDTISHAKLYSDPQKWGYVRSMSKLTDVNGDGLMDFRWVGNPWVSGQLGSWISKGDGSYSVSTGGSTCIHPIDFNGDGRSDCLYASSNPTYNSLASSTPVAQFNLTVAGNELMPTWEAQSTGIGVEIVDLNGDGRSDLVRWHDDPTKTVAYLSRGDGSFAPSTTFDLNTATRQLRKLDGSVDFLMGDFTGDGTVQFLRMRSALAAGEATSNQLYVKASKAVPDQLSYVVNATGLRTDLNWVSLANTSRYTSDRGTANAAAYPKIDLTVPIQVVASTVSDTGVGTSTTATEYSYAGLKAAYDGRGAQGFRETRRQSPGADGTAMTVVTRYLQDPPYSGVASQTETYLGTLNALSGEPLSRSTYTYCEKTASAAAEAAATPSAPCPVPTSTKIQRPYLYKSVEEGRDLAGNVLPSVTTVNAFNGTGDPTSIQVTTSGTAAGLNQTFTKTTTNQYYPDDTADDRWILGRLQRASQHNTIANPALPSTGYGSAPLANATQGSAPSASLSTPSFASIQIGLNTTANATLSNSSSVSIQLVPPQASSVSGTDFSFVSTTCGSTLGAGASCAVTVRFAPTAAVTSTGTLSVVTELGTKTASLSGTGLTPAGLVLSSCSSTTTTAPTAATMSCTLSNTGQVGISSISYSAIANATVSGPTGACAGTSTCGTVTVTTGTAAGTYSGTLTATPNTGTAASTSVSLTVRTPAALAFSGCSSTSPTTPTAATLSCTLSNTGQTPIGSISYSAIANATVSGPTGACAGNSTCGIVTVTTATAAGAYSGTLTATPDTGSAASNGVSLTVRTQAALSLSGCSSTSPTTTPTAATLSCTLSNTGQTTVDAISYSSIANATVSGPTGACAANATCGTVTVTTAAAAGTYSGTLTAIPNTGNSASQPVSLTVRTQPALSFSGCASNSPTTVPTPATMSCTVSNVGQTALGSISYTSIAGAVVTGPTGACAAGTTCGTVTVTSGTATGTYSGTLTATPNVGSPASQAVSLVVSGPIAFTYVSGGITGTTTYTATFRFTFRNDNASAVTITDRTAQSDDIDRTISTSSTCVVGSSLGPSATCTIIFTAPKVCEATNGAISSLSNVGGRRNSAMLSVPYRPSGCDI